MQRLTAAEAGQAGCVDYPYTGALNTFVVTVFRILRGHSKLDTLVFLCIASPQSDRNRSPWVSAAQLATAVRGSRRQVQLSLARLEKNGHIVRSRTDQHSWALAPRVIETDHSEALRVIETDHSGGLAPYSSSTSRSLLPPSLPASARARAREGALGREGGTVVRELRELFGQRWHPSYLSKLISRCEAACPEVTGDEIVKFARRRSHLDNCKTARYAPGVALDPTELRAWLRSRREPPQSARQRPTPAPDVVAVGVGAARVLAALGGKKR